MSYTSIPNQPIIFNTTLPEQCEGCNSGFSQLVDFNDQLFWQLETGVCGELGFKDSTPFGAWSVSGGTVIGSGGGGYEQQMYRYDTVTTFKITLTVTSYTSGSFDCFISQPFTSVVNINTVGTHTFYLICAFSLDNFFTFTFSTATGFDGEFTVDSIEPIPTGSLFAGIVDAETLSVVQVLDPVLTVKDQYLTAGVDLSTLELSAGCYRLAIADYCTNTCGQYFIDNPFFNSRRLSNGWTSVPVVGSVNWTVGGGQAAIELSGTNATELVSVTELCEDKDYYVSIVVDTIDNCTLELQVDGITYGSPITAAGTYNFVITTTSSGPVSLLGTCLGGGREEIIVTSIIVRVDKNWVSYDKYSDTISIGDYSDDCRFFKIEGCNGENQFGLAFYGTSFLPGIRLEGRRFQPQYDTDTDLFRYSSGRWQASFVDRKKKVSYHFGRLPEYVLDFLSIVFYFDNCYVNGDTVFPADNEFPTIEYDNADDLGSLTIELYNKRDKVRKTVCVGVDADCLPSILDNDDEPFILTQDGERITTQDLINLYQE